MHPKDSQMPKNEQGETPEARKSRLIREALSKPLAMCDSCGEPVHNGIHGSETTCDDCISGS